MVEPSKAGIARIKAAFGYSMRGLQACWRMEAAFRQEIMASIILIPLGLYLGQGGVEKALLVGVYFLVIIIEVLNSGIEAVVDRIGREHHELSGLAKDLGSSAVLLSLLMFAATWILVLFF
ncbi:MAG: diacylglycerol kinase [SAR86 cluster bacterium]|uniref:Diacylglycerol kinase n=1 Tax=SAR86 cluster bacterium TaxID=2030880 RepID=A0A2A5CDW4_9GAMM|nr:diacylglycerol kinase [Gammaproteobacteria bacterium AH-315-E17]PCJ41711.1 MAG: diacylglycerol kinase [SAR86 cluster bacterium]